MNHSANHATCNASKSAIHWRKLLLAAAMLALANCASDRPLTEDQRHALQQPPASVAADVARLQPGVANYIRQAEQAGLARGRALTADESALAVRVGVAHPERVRVIVASAFPVPADPALTGELKSRFGIDGKANGGLTMGHAIFVATKYADARWLLAHELTHVGQFETLGVDQFAHDYLVQLIMVGYTRAPIEEAARMNEHLGRE